MEVDVGCALVVWHFLGAKKAFECETMYKSFILPRKST